MNLKESQNINITASAFMWHYRALETWHKYGKPGCTHAALVESFELRALQLDFGPKL